MNQPHSCRPYACTSFRSRYSKYTLLTRASQRHLAGSPQLSNLHDTRLLQKGRDLGCALWSSPHRTQLAPSPPRPTRLLARATGRSPLGPANPGDGTTTRVERLIDRIAVRRYPEISGTLTAAVVK